ncbi:DUF2887 domain-containing protein [Spirulina sp. CS-785/01]|uniref:DUF2887 domain-containing protein n=1 Tax=Spirulina sp. CS-785/01 TaxID=3021716 RepID=UPI003FA76234
MKTDPIFYRLFKELPSSFFELIGQPPSQASAYRFDSVELKQTAFRVDGVFLPLEESLPLYFTLGTISKRLSNLCASFFRDFPLSATKWL